MYVCMYICRYCRYKIYFLLVFERKKCISTNTLEADYCYNSDDCSKVEFILKSFSHLLFRAFTLDAHIDMLLK